MNPGLDAATGLAGVVIGRLFVEPTVFDVDRVPIRRGLRSRADQAETGWSAASRVGVVAATGTLFVAIAARSTSAWLIPAYCALAAALVAIAAIDARELRIPSRLVYLTLSAGVPLLMIDSAVLSRWSALLRATAMGAGGFAAFVALHIVTSRGVGFGDARLAGLCGLFLGWLGFGAAELALLVATMSAGAVAAALLLAGMARRRTFIAFGPFLAIGTVTSVLVNVGSFVH